MGLFKKYPCPICGEETTKFLATKFEGQPLCGACGCKVLELPGGSSALNGMTIDTLREYGPYYDENAALRSTFQESYRYKFGFLGDTIVLDLPHRFLRFGTGGGTIVFEASEIRSFSILEDEVPLFEGTKDELICYQSAIPDKVRNLGPEIDRYNMEQRQYEQMERMEEMLKEKAKERGESYSSQYYSAPSVDRLKPFGYFNVKVELDNPYCQMHTCSQGAPGFSSTDPSITSYLHDYDESVGKLHELATQLMAILNADAPERQVSVQEEAGARTAPAASAAPVDAVTEIQRYKALLDSGALTEEEFTAKKRQLLGI